MKIEKILQATGKEQLKVDCLSELLLAMCGLRVQDFTKGTKRYITNIAFNPDKNAVIVNATQYPASNKNYVSMFLGGKESRGYLVLPKFEDDAEKYANDDYQHFSYELLEKMYAQFSVEKANNMTYEEYLVFNGLCYKTGSFAKAMEICSKNNQATPRSMKYDIIKWGIFLNYFSYRQLVEKTLKQEYDTDVSAEELGKLPIVFKTKIHSLID